MTPWFKPIKMKLPLSSYLYWGFHIFLFLDSTLTENKTKDKRLLMTVVNHIFLQSPIPVHLLKIVHTSKQFKNSRTKRSVVNRMFRLFAFTGSIHLRHTTMPCASCFGVVIPWEGLQFQQEKSSFSLGPKPWNFSQCRLSWSWKLFIFFTHFTWKFVWTTVPLVISACKIYFPLSEPRWLWWSIPPREHQCRSQTKRPTEAGGSC